MKRKILIATTLMVAAGFAAYEKCLAMRWRDRSSALEIKNRSLPGQLLNLQRECDAMTNRLAVVSASNEGLRRDLWELPKLRSELTQLQKEGQKLRATTGTDDPASSPTEDWRLSTVEQLKQTLAQRSECKIPELQFLTSEDWLSCAETAAFESDDEVRHTLSNLRGMAKRHFAGILGKALRDYTNANGGRLPDTLLDLTPYFSTPVDSSMLQRYQLVKTGNIKDVRSNEVLIAEQAPVDNDHDTLFRITPVGVFVEQVSAAARESQALRKLAQ